MASVDGLAPDVGAWVCGECGHANPRREGISGLTCEACGLARRGAFDMTLDIPARPRLTEVAGFWYALGWGALLILGGVLLASDGARATIGIGRGWVLFEVVGAAYAAGSSLLSALWDRWLNQLTLEVPPRVRTGESFEAVLRLVPYVRLDGVNVSIALIDRFYERQGRELRTRSRHLGRFRLLRGGSLPGRREAVFAATFAAPFPTTKHSDVGAEITADVLDVLGTFVPAARWNARNLREHGGYLVEVSLRVGLVPRRLVKRVFVYHLGEQVHVG